jgi:hypothetical protein
MIESPRPDLDAAIDRVAAKLVEVRGDEELLARTMAHLPERKATPWFLAMRVQLVAAAAVVLVAFIFARPSRELLRPEGPQVAVSAPAVAPIPDPRPLVPDSRLPTPAFAKATAGKPDSRLRQGYGGQARLPAERREDHERSLAPVAAIDAIELGGIAPPAMELDAAAALEPLVLRELALDIKGDS